MAAQKQPKGAGVCRPQLGVFTEETQNHRRSKAPLLSGVKEGRGCHYSLFPKHQSLPQCGLPENLPQPPPWGALLPLWALTPQLPPQPALGTDASGLPTHRGGAETTGEPQEPHDLKSRAKISPRWLQIYTSNTSFVDSTSVRHPSGQWGLPQGMCMGAGLGQSLNCLMSSHSGSRCKTTTVPGHDFSGSMLVDLCKQHRRDTQGQPLGILRLRWGQIVVCFVYQRNEWQATQQSALTGEQLQQRNAQAPLPVGALHPHLPGTARLRGRPGGFHSNSQGSRSRP